MADFIAVHSGREVVVRSPQAVEFGRRLAVAGSRVRAEGDALVVTGFGAAEVGALAAAEGVELHELTLRQTSLERAFMELTQDSVEFSAGKEAA